MTSLEIKPEHRKCSIPAKLKSFHGQRMRFDLDFTLTMNLVPQWFVATHQVGGVLGQFRPCQFNIRKKGKGLWKFSNNALIPMSETY